MKEIHSYWNGEGKPAVLVNLPNRMLQSYLMQPDTALWQVVTEADVLEWFKARAILEAEVFEQKFDKIGLGLPELPEI